MIKQILTFIIVVATLLIMTSLISSDTKANPSSKSKKKPRVSAKVKVLTSKVVNLRSNRVFEAMGTGKAKLSAEIYPEVSAEVVNVNFKTQDKVKSGQTLVELDDREARLALKLAEIKYSDSKKILKRFEQATPTGAASQTELDRAKTDHDIAYYELQQKKLDLAKRKIKAPFDGIVGIPNIDVGDRVNPSLLITGLDDRRTLFVDFEVPESLAGKLQQNQAHQVVASTPAYPTKTFQAILTAQESRIDPKRRTLMVRAEIDNEADNLRPGMSFSTRWQIKGGLFPAVPEIALQWSRKGAYVWIVREGIVNKVAVRVEFRKDSMVLVDGDLKNQEEVVIEGLQRLRHGLSVSVLGNNS